MGFSTGVPWISCAGDMKKGRPDLKLTVFGPEKLRDLWEALPEVDRYIGKADKEGLLAVARRIKNSGIHFDAGILLTNSTRSTLAFKLGGVPHLVGYTGSFRSRFLRHKIREVKVKGPPIHHTDRYLHIAHRLTGWNAVKQRADQLQLNLSDPQVKEVTARIKAEADVRRLSLDDVDALLSAYHSEAAQAEGIGELIHAA